MFLNNQSIESINKHEQLKVNLNIPHKSQQIILQKNNISYTLLDFSIEDNAYRFILFGVFLRSRLRLPTPTVLQVNLLSHIAWIYA